MISHIHGHHNLLRARFKAVKTKAPTITINNWGARDDHLRFWQVPYRISLSILILLVIELGNMNVNRETEEQQKFLNLRY
mmetsp:Transcript_1438/g.3246  ORF Transcript_1438/g.3246 Transcript_1438/m.3246 type:complete len:80 (-) Transcript_1438:21-260(-)